MHDALIDGPTTPTPAEADARGRSPRPTPAAGAALRGPVDAGARLLDRERGPALDRRPTSGFSESGLQWVISAYALTFGGFLMLGGRAADLFGRRRVFMAGLALFSAASLAGRVRQGAVDAGRGPGPAGGGRGDRLAGGALAPDDDLRRRPGAEPGDGLVRHDEHVGFAVGMMLGGLLTGSVGWEWVMFINVPIGLVVIALAPLALPSGGDAPPTVGFDLLGRGPDHRGVGLAGLRPLGRRERRAGASRQTLGLLAVSLAPARRASSRSSVGWSTRWSRSRSSAGATWWGRTSSASCWRRRSRR